MRLPRGMILAMTGMALATTVRAAAPASDPSDMARGSPNAPITIIEYASVGCPHCAALHRDVFPEFKKKYIDTGQVRWVSREVLTGDPSLAAGGFLLARCAGKDHYFDVTDAIYRDQAKIDADLHDGLLAVAKSVGMTEDQFTACLRDKANLDALDARTQLSQADGIRSTPSLVVDGKIVADSEVSMAELDKIVADARKGPAKPAADAAQKKKK